MVELKEYKLHEIGRLITGRTPASNLPELLGDGAAFITPTDISEHSIYAAPQRRLSSKGEKEFQRILLPTDAVCFTCIASIGKMCLTRELSMTNQQINSLVVDTTRFVSRWVFYILKSMREDIAAIASGAATPIINKSSFGNVQIIAPPSKPSAGLRPSLGPMMI